MDNERRPDPEQLLRQVQEEERYLRRGRLKIFLGYAGGVGKSYRMLDEGRRRHERGEDVVIGAIQPKVSAEVEALLQKLEVIPLATIGSVPVMDLPAILRRHPQVCLIDGLAYDNPPGSLHPKRWQDAEDLLAEGISVIATVNLQYIEERQEEVERITGRRTEQSVPESFLRNADEIELVDAPPEISLQRSGEQPRPDESEPEEGQIRLNEQQLSQLREVALVLAAEVVDHQLETYLVRHNIEELWGTQERFLVFVTSQPDATAMIASGRRNADRFHGELFVGYINRPDMTPEDRAALEKNLAQARAAGAQIEALDGEDPVDTIMAFARGHGITQIFLANRKRESLWARLFGGPLDQLIRAAETIDIRVFPQ